MKWAEFPSWEAAATWVEGGNVAITPTFIERAGGGESRYMIAKDRRTFVEACRALGSAPSDLPRDRASINLDTENLLRALVLCGSVAGPGEYRPWESRCPTCSLPFNNVAFHASSRTGAVVNLTQVACAAGHRWRV